MMTGSTIPKEFEITSLVFSVAVTVSTSIGTFGNMALSIPSSGVGGLSYERGGDARRKF